MLSASLSSFSIGAASSLLASLVVIALTNLDEVHYFFTSRRKYKYLGGNWYQYHLTSDTKHDPSIFWSAHEVSLEITSFGRVRGKTRPRHSSKSNYRIRGSIRQNVLRLRVTNQAAQEIPASVTYPRLLSDSILVGIWIGHDFNEHMSAGPMVLTRTELDSDQLTRIVHNERILRTVRGSAETPIIDLVHGSADFD